MAVESSYLEHTISQLILILADVQPELLRALIGKTMFEARLEMFKDLGDLRLDGKPDVQAAFLDLIKEIKDANRGRSLVIHGLWLPLNIELHKGKLVRRGNTPSAIKRRRGKSALRGTDGFEVVSIAPAREVAAALSQSKQKLAAFFSQHMMPG